MIDKVPSLAQLLKTLQRIPYLASKNVYRVADHFLNMDEEKLEQVCAIILQAQQNIMHCPICYVWQEAKGSCVFCTAEHRDKKVICVLETWQDLLAIEQTKGYTGVYHVLGGAICPLDGIGPEDLSIEPLLKRVESGAQELILALSQTPEGEATSAYIANKVKNKSITISCLARGLPVGSSLEAMDRLTVYKALSERRPF